METRIPQQTTGRGHLIKVESLSRPGHFHEVNVETGECPCDATVKRCRHYRIAKIQAFKAKRLMDPSERRDKVESREIAELAERLNHELLDMEERCELSSRLATLKRRAA